MKLANSIIFNINAILSGKKKNINVTLGMVNYLRFGIGTYISWHKTLICSLCILDKTGWNYKTCCTTSLPPVLDIDQWFKSPSTGEHIQVSTVI
jgi:hypothetical protein